MNTIGLNMEVETLRANSPASGAMLSDLFQLIKVDGELAHIPKLFHGHMRR